MTTAQLVKVPGIGTSTAGKTREFVDTGAVTRITDLRQQFSAEMMELTRIPGLGPETVVMLQVHTFVIPIS